MKIWIKPRDRYTQGSAQQVAKKVKGIIQDWNDIPESFCHPHCDGAVFEWNGRRHYITKECSKDEIVKRLKGEVWTSRDLGAIVFLLGILVFLWMVGWAAADLVFWLF